MIVKFSRIIVTGDILKTVYFAHINTNLPYRVIQLVWGNICNVKRH